jgi:WD40 repeat protein
MLDIFEAYYERNSQLSVGDGMMKREQTVARCAGHAAVLGRVGQLGVWLVCALALVAHGQGRPNILWMQGGHTLDITGVAYSLDGQIVVSAGFDRTVKIWRVSDGALIRTLIGHTDSILCVALSPDGTLIASGGRDRTIRVWRVSDGALLHTLTGGVGYVSSVAFSPDGQQIVSGNADGTIRVWRVADGRLIRTVRAHTSAIGNTVFSPDGRLLAFTVGNTIELWDVSRWERVRTLTGHTSVARCVVFAPNGRILASGGADGTVRFWRVSDGMLLQTYDEETSLDVLSIAFSPDGQLFGYGRYDGTVVVAHTPTLLRDGDVNNDGCVDDTDLLQVLFVFGQSGSNLPEDLNNDGTVNDSDLLEVLSNFGRGCEN